MRAASHLLPHALDDGQDHHGAHLGGKGGGRGGCKGGRAAGGREVQEGRVQGREEGRVQGGDDYRVCVWVYGCVRVGVCVWVCACACGAPAPPHTVWLMKVVHTSTSTQKMVVTRHSSMVTTSSLMDSAMVASRPLLLTASPDQPRVGWGWGVRV